MVSPAGSLHPSGSASNSLKRAGATGLTWEPARDLDDAELEARVFEQRRAQRAGRVPIDFEWVHRELRKTGVTLQTLWVDYQEGARLSHIVVSSAQADSVVTAQNA